MLTRLAYHVKLFIFITGLCGLHLPAGGFFSVSVDAADAVTAGDTRPVTSAAVQVEIGNIEVLLHTI